MQLLKQDKPQCFLYAFAMALGHEPGDMIKEIGHDGLKKLWPSEVGVAKYQGHHPQELIDYCLDHEYAVVIIEAVPNVQSNHNEPKMIWPIETCTNRLLSYLKQYNGVLTSYNHAVAWSCEEQLCYDPNGLTYSIDSFNPQYFFALVDLIN